MSGDEPRCILPEDVVRRVDSLMSPFGFEVDVFKVGWYNEVVAEAFQFQYDYDTLAVNIVSTPEMFDKTLLPYILRQECPGKGDPLDGSITELFTQIKEEFGNDEVEAIHDFELLPSRRPKVLVQTSGHVAGSAYYYQRKHLDPDPWDKKKSIYGVSIHPKYGGWFALRGVLIFKNIVWPDMPRKQPVDCVATWEQRKELLEQFNHHWQDGAYRDIIPVERKYSELQIEYFSLLPKDRHAIFDKLKAEGCKAVGCS